MAHENLPLGASANGESPDLGVRPSFVPVLLYHAIADDPHPGREPFTVTRRAFSEHVRAIASSGRTPVTISRLAACLRGEAPWPRDPIAIRIDDGYDDTRDAVEILLDAGLVVTIYVTSGTVDSSDGIDARSVSELAALAPMVEIGSHSVNHPFLDELSSARLAEEICTSRDMLEHLTAIPITSFAYPYGAFSRDVRQAVVDAGYQSAAAVKNAVARPDEDVFAIAAWTVAPGTSAGRVAEVMQAHDVPLAWRHERVRTTAFRQARLLKRRLRVSGPR